MSKQRNTEDLPALAEEVFAAMYEGKAVSPRAEQLRAVYEDIYARMRENPSLTDSQLTRMLRETHGRSRRQAYRDLANIKAMMGNVRQASREWHQYTFNEMIKRAYQDALEKENIPAAIQAASAYARFNQLDKPEAQTVDWGQLVPQSFEPTMDVAALGLEGVGDVEALREKLAKEFGVARRRDVIDTEAREVDGH